MPTIEEVKKQIKELGDTADVKTWWVKKEVQYLPEVLAPDEKILAITSGFLDTNTWVIVLTYKRVIFLDKGMLFGLKQKEIPLSKINSIEHKTGLVFGELAVWDGASKTIIKNMIKKTVKPFVDELNKAIENSKSGHQHKPASDVTDAFVTQMERLGALKEKGLITQSEFEEQKRILLKKYK